MPFLAPLAPFAAPIIGGAVSAVGGALLNRKSGGVTKELQPLQTDLLNRLRARLANPGEGLEPLKTSAKTNVNKLYQGGADTLATRLAARGFGGAGSDGRTVRSQVDLDLDRFRALGGVDMDFARLETDRERDTIAQIQQLLGRGTYAPTPGNRAAGALDGGLSAFTQLATLLRGYNPSGGSTLTSGGAWDMPRLTSNG